MRGILIRIVLGFLAAAVAVIVVHEAIIYGLSHAGLFRGTAWGMRPIPPWGVPRLVNSVFWGGLWGVLFALVYERLPGGMGWLKGLIYGLLIVVVGNWTLLPLVKGRILGQPDQVLFGGLDPWRMLSTILIVGGFGLTLGVIYGLVRSKQA